MYGPRAASIAIRSLFSQLKTCEFLSATTNTLQGIIFLHILMSQIFGENKEGIIYSRYECTREIIFQVAICHVLIYECHLAVIITITNEGDQISVMYCHQELSLQAMILLGR